MVCIAPAVDNLIQVCLENQIFVRAYRLQLKTIYDKSQLGWLFYSKGDEVGHPKIVHQFEIKLHSNPTVISELLLNLYQNFIFLPIFYGMLLK